MSAPNMATVEFTSTPRAAPGVEPRAPTPRARERRRARLRALRRGLGLTAIAALTGLALYALRPRPVPIDAARVTRGPLEVAVEESGVTRVIDRYRISAPVSGSLSRVTFEPGDAVREGDVLAEIAPAESPLIDGRAAAEAEARLGAALSALGQAEAQQARASAARQLAEQELARARALAVSGALAAEAVEQAEFAARMRGQELSSAAFARKVASEQVRVARAALGRSEGRGPVRHVDVIAPVSGRILAVQQKSAGVISSGAALLELADPSALEVVVDLLTTDAVHVQPGTFATIEGWGGARSLSGRVRRIEPSAFTRPSALGVDEQRVNVIIALTAPQSDWKALGDGYRVEARIVLWHSKDVVKAPLGAVFRHGNSWAAYRIDDGIAKLTRVQVGHRGATEVEIVAGLTPAHVVAVHPGDRVKDGARVEPR